MAHNIDTADDVRHAALKTMLVNLVQDFTGEVHDWSDVEVTADAVDQLYRGELNKLRAESRSS